MLSKSCVVNHVWFLGDWIFGRTTALLGASENTISHTVSQSVVFEIASSFQVLWKAVGGNIVKSGYSGRLWSTVLAVALLNRCLPQGWREPTWSRCRGQPLQRGGVCGHSAPSQQVSAALVPTAGTTVLTQASAGGKEAQEEAPVHLCHADKSRLIYIQCCIAGISQ